MTYQPVVWTQELLLALRHTPLDVNGIYQSLDIRDVERCSIDRLALLIQDIRESGISRPRVADLGCSGGFFSVGLAVSVAAHVTAVDDERYITIQGESAKSSLEQFRARIDKLGINNISVINQPVESFLAQHSGGASAYDIVLLLNIIHHFATGYGQQSLVGKLGPDEFVDFLQHLGRVTEHILYFETNAKYFDNYESVLIDMMLYGGFDSLTCLGFSLATDGSRRILWRVSKPS
jgi:hypothetical protein